MVFKCKMCGGDIEVVEGSNIGKCLYCKSTMTLPSVDNEKLLNLYNRANNLRLSNEFDKAYGVYETILEIGGQDSKIIILRDGIVTDFAMNTVCAAGTGSFLDHQAQRLNVPIEEFGATALKSTNPARIAGRCGVFAESDLIHKQQLGYPVEDLLYGLCQALARNYLSNLALGKDLLPTISFQGGVASNKGMVKAFEEALNTNIVVPENHQTMGAIGAALLAMENYQYTERPTTFRGWEVGDMHFASITCDCNGCSNQCEVVTIVEGMDEHEHPHYENIQDIQGNIIARWGGTCGRWDLS